MTSNIYIKNHLREYEMVVILINYLRETWETNYNPNLEKIKFDLQIDDKKSEYLCKRAITHLINRKFIKLENDLIEIRRIVKGINPLPDKYEYWQFWDEN
ncbi:MAG: hypothetical protein ACFFAO_10495 [Candidatus Hermodarchaeota archaeon]